MTLQERKTLEACKRKIAALLEKNGVDVSKDMCADMKTLIALKSKLKGSPESKRPELSIEDANLLKLVKKLFERSKTGDCDGKCIKESKNKQLINKYKKFDESDDIPHPDGDEYVPEELRENDVLRLFGAGLDIFDFYNEPLVENLISLINKIFERGNKYHNSWLEEHRVENISFPMFFYAVILSLEDPELINDINNASKQEETLEVYRDRLKELKKTGNPHKVGKKQDAFGR